MPMSLGFKRLTRQDRSSSFEQFVHEVITTKGKPTGYRHVLTRILPRLATPGEPLPLSKGTLQGW